MEAHFYGVAEAWLVIRKVLRIVDEGAKEAGLGSLEHQALIQVFAWGRPMRVIELAGRLGIPPTFASQVTIGLEQKGLVTRSRSPMDRRTTAQETTSAERDVLVAIDRVVSTRVDDYTGCH